MGRIISDRKAGILGIISPVIAMIFIGVSISLNPWFDWANHALSDLGAIGESYNLIFNFGIILAGFFGILFSIRLRNICNTIIGSLGSVGFGVGMVSLFLVGIFPLGLSPHYFVSVAFFLSAAIGITIVGIDQLLEKETRPWGVFTLSIVITGVVSVILIQRIPYDLGIAIPEFIGATIFTEFSTIYGIRLATN